MNCRSISIIGHFPHIPILGPSRHNDSIGCITLLSSWDSGMVLVVFRGAPYSLMLKTIKYGENDYEHGYNCHPQGNK